MVHLHHAAISTDRFAEYTEFFLHLGMSVQKKSGTDGNRQIWFNEGIQLKETEKITSGDSVDHIALYTDDMEQTLETAYAFGCTAHPKGVNWFVLPNGVSIELMI